MTAAVCGICLSPTGRELNPNKTDYCDNHSVTRGYWLFWDQLRIDLDKLPDEAIEDLKTALINALKSAANVKEPARAQDVYCSCEKCLRSREFAKKEGHLTFKGHLVRTEHDMQFVDFPYPPEPEPTDA